jgi:hypothetical protein
MDWAVVSGEFQREPWRLRYRSLIWCYVACSLFRPVMNYLQGADLTSSRFLQDLEQCHHGARERY